MSAIPSNIPLALGIIAGSIFLLLFSCALVMTMRNRRIIRNHSDIIEDANNQTADDKKMIEQY